MIEFVVILGPWGSGTSAVMGALDIMGLNTVGPYLRTNDPRTQNSYESLSLRKIILKCFDENTLSNRPYNRTDLINQLKAWKKENTITTGTYVEKIIAVKIPHLCFFVPEMVEAWDPFFVVVMRPLQEIENSRIRRKWHVHYGIQGARACYSKAFWDLSEMNRNFFCLSYNRLITHPEPSIKSLAGQMGLIVDKKTQDAISGWVRERTFPEAPESSSQ